MPGNFDFVDDKLREADFFLERLRDTGSDFEHARFYFSAFVSASRSVTFVLQSVLADVDGFKSWYAEKQNALRAEPLAKFFLEVRNEVQKRGSNPLSSLSSTVSADQTRKIEYYFIYWFGESPKGLPDLDVATACEQYLTVLARLVYQCYRDFGSTIDPEQYYTLENLARLGLSVEDVLESELGFPRQWASSIDPEQVLRQIRDNAPKPDVDDLFLKYLGHDRFGRSAEH
ncbi:MAG: hypothetical protein WBW16_09340 [Bacteroidota bacterium]